MVQLFQQHFLEKKTFHLNETGMKATSSTLFNSSSNFYPFELIETNHIRRVFKFDKFYAGISLISLLIVIRSIVAILAGDSRFYEPLLFVAGGFLLIFGTWTMLSKKHVLIIPVDSMGEFEMFDKNPSEMDTKSFLDKLKQKQHKYLRTRYAVINPDHPQVEQLWNLDMLVLKEVITNKEYQQLRSKLLDNKTVVKGFSKD